MKKLEKLKINEMQDYSLISVEEQKTLKGSGDEDGGFFKKLLSAVINAVISGSGSGSGSGSSTSGTIEWEGASIAWEETTITEDSTGSTTTEKKAFSFNTGGVSVTLTKEDIDTASTSSDTTAIPDSVQTGLDSLLNVINPGD